MLNLDQNFLAKSQNVFVQKPLVSLADVRQKVQSDMSLAPTQKRDIISAMNRVEAGSGRPLAEIKAGAAEARKLLAGLTPAGLKVSDKTFSNIKSSFALAVRLHGVKIVPVTKRIPVAPEWQALLDQVKTIYLRQGLYRLATFCTVMAIPPHNVSSDTLRGLYKALEGEELVKQPRTILKITITSWNKCYREIPGWPRLLLSSPFKTAPTTIALDKFPAEFQKEIQEWARGLLKPDILDEAAVDRPLSQTTVEHRILQIRQLASHLVNSGRIKIEEIASIAVLLKPELFKEGMRCFLARHEGRSTTRIYNLANSLRHIAKNHCGFSEDDLALLKQTCKRLDPGGRRQMTPKNRQLLQQFDAAENVSQLLCYPEQQAAMAIKDKNTKRAAKRFERAVVMDLLLHCGLRSGTLRSLRITDFDFKADAREESVFLYIPAEDTKTNRPMEFELPKDTAQRLQKFIHDYRPLLSGANSPYLFPGVKGGFRSKNAMYESIKGGLKKDANLNVNPHSLRHIIPKIAVEQDPNAYASVSRVLGHTTMDTTMAHYMGTETKVAGKHLDRLLTKAKETARQRTQLSGRVRKIKGGHHA